MCAHHRLRVRRDAIRGRCIQIHAYFDRKNPPSPGGFPVYYVPSSRTASKRTPLEEPRTNFSRGVLLLTVLDEGT